MLVSSFINVIIGSILFLATSMSQAQPQPGEFNAVGALKSLLAHPLSMTSDLEFYHPQSTRPLPYETSCMNQPSFNVIVEDAKLNQTISLKKLQEFHLTRHLAVSHAEDSEHSKPMQVGHYESQLSLSAHYHVQANPPSLTTYCFSFMDFKVSIPSTIYIARELQAPSCLFTEGVRHEEKHHYVSLTTAAIAMNRFMRNNPLRITPLGMSSDDDAVIRTHISAYLTRATEFVEDEILLAQKQVDTIDEYHRVSSQCRDELAALRRSL